MTDTLKDEIIALTTEAVEKAYQMGLTAGAAAEREACAKVCDELHYAADAYGAQCAEAIRARGQA
jgi:hypothetical protein